MCYQMRVGMQRLPYAYRAASATTLTAPCEDAKSKGFDTYYSLYKNKYGLEYEPEGLLVEANFMGLNTKNLLLPNLLGKKLNRTTRKSRVRFPLQACKRLALKGMNDDSSGAFKAVFVHREMAFTRYPVYATI